MTPPEKERPSGRPSSPAESGKSAEAKVSPEQAHEFLRLAGRAISNATLYGLHHPLAEAAVDDCYRAFEEMMKPVSRINISVAERDLLVEGKPADLRNPFIRMLADRLHRLEVAGFSLLRGMPREEFRRFIEILATPPPEDEGPDAVLRRMQQQDLRYILAERVKYERVTESQAIVDREEEETVRRALPMVQQILAFLKGDTDTLEKEPLKTMEDAADDASRLAELIMEATAIRQRTTGLAEGETLADIVIGCLRRTFDGLLATRHASSQKGRRIIRKTLLLLEKEILDRLRGVAGELSPGELEAISEAVSDMVEQLDVDSLASEYVKRMSALKKAEDRIRRYIKRRGEQALSPDDPLARCLIESGLSPDGWSQLVVSSIRSSAPSGMELRIPSGIGALAALLEELDELMKAPEGKSAELRQVMERIGNEVERAADRTEARIGELEKKLAAQEETLIGVEEAERQKIRLSRRAMLELLAEIAQELAQSLSAINCAVGMLLARHLGDINNDQQDVLQVAARCGERLDKLLERLVEIVGLPSGLTPEKERAYTPLRPPPPGA
ncbi:MAG: hypothetical protein DRP22_00635 [Verrucomicrobia bacterium]|nr:MAG: hypothetical protein DRP22_00635 [Verrucomicrobiota bacterium]